MICQKVQIPFHQASVSKVQEGNVDRLDNCTNNRMNLFSLEVTSGSEIQLALVEALRQFQPRQGLSINDVNMFVPLIDLENDDAPAQSGIEGCSKFGSSTPSTDTGNFLNSGGNSARDATIDTMNLMSNFQDLPFQPRIMEQGTGKLYSEMQEEVTDSLKSERLILKYKTPIRILYGLEDMSSAVRRGEVKNSDLEASTAASVEVPSFFPDTTI